MLQSTSFDHIWPLAVGIVVLVLMVLAIIATFRSQAMTTTAKVIWTLVILLLPLIGLIVWALVWFTGGRQAAKKARTV